MIRWNILNTIKIDNMKFKEYKKIQGLHKEECDGILIGKCYIQEKLDGANASIWLGDDGEIHFGSRTRDLFLAKDNFNGFGDWVKENLENLKNIFFAHPNYRLNGEWLVRHTIGYNETSYKKFYLFDIDAENEESSFKLPLEEVYLLARDFNIPTAKLFDVIINPSLEQIKQFAGKSELGQKGEGVVIKNMEFVNKFGDQQFGKYVTQEFKEDNAITFGGNNKSSETYCEMYFVNKFMNLARVQKIFHKLESMEGRLDYKHIPRIMGMCYHDLITEESWTIAQEMGKSGKFFDFKAFKQICDKKAKSIFIELLTGDVSVAHFSNVSDKENHAINSN